MSRILKQVICTANSSAPSAAASQAVVANGMVYVSGILGVDKNTNQLVPGGVEEQTEMALKNLAAVLESAGSGIDHAVRNTIFMRDYNDYGKITDIHNKYFSKAKPARTSLQVSSLAMDALVEIDSIAVVDN